MIAPVRGPPIVAQDVPEPWIRGVAEIDCEEIAERFSARLGKELTPENVRKLLSRAREKFAALLLEEVERSMGNPSCIVTLHLGQAI